MEETRLNELRKSFEKRCLTLIEDKTKNSENYDDRISKLKIALNDMKSKGTLKICFFKFESVCTIIDVIIIKSNFYALILLLMSLYRVIPFKQTQTVSTNLFLNLFFLFFISPTSIFASLYTSSIFFDFEKNSIRYNNRFRRCKNGNKKTTITITRRKRYRD